MKLKWRVNKQNRDVQFMRVKSFPMLYKIHIIANLKVSEIIEKVKPIVWKTLSKLHYIDR